MDNDALTRFPPKSILAPIDFSEPSAAGLSAARRLSERFGARLELLHVDEEHALMHEGAMSEKQRAAAAERAADGEARLRELAGLPEPAVRVVRGDAKGVLVELARGERHDMIVMGSHGRSGMERALLGSVAETLVMRSSIPVLTVHEKPRPLWPVHVLVPMKFAPYADAALLYALRLASAAGARVTLMHSIEEGPLGGEAHEALEAHLERLLGNDAWTKAGRLLDAGPAADKILKAVDTGTFDLVVLAAHRKLYWKDFVLGTTSERVLRRSRVPVLSIPSSSALTALGEPAAHAAARG